MRLLVDLQFLQASVSSVRGRSGLDLLAGLERRRGENDSVMVLLHETNDPRDLLRAREAVKGLVACDIVVRPRVNTVGDGHDDQRRLAARAVLTVCRDVDAVLLVDPPLDDSDRWWSTDRHVEAPRTFVVCDAPLPAELSASCALVLVGLEPDQAAERVWAAALEEAEPKAPPGPPVGVSRPSLGLVSPWPPTRSGVADLAASTLGHLAEHYDVTVVNDGPWSEPQIRHVTRAEFRDEWWQYDRVLYHLGNNAHHAQDLELLGEAPGAVIVHDAVLSGAIRSVAGAFGHPGGVDSLLAWDGPEPGAGKLDLRGTRAALAPALGILVHSHHARQLLRQAGVTTPPVHVSPLPVTRTRHESRRELGRHVTGVPVLAHFGFVNEFKGAAELIDAAGWLIRNGRPCRVTFVGEFLDRRLRRKVVGQAATLGVPLEITGFVAPDEWTRWLESSACAVQLRQLSHGESSAALGELLIAGLPVVCTDTGSFAEIPNEVVTHVSQGLSGEQLAEVIAKLLEPAEAERQGRASQEYAERALSPGQWAGAVVAMIEESYAGNPGLLWAAATSSLPPGPAPDLYARAFRRPEAAVWLSDTSVYARTPFFSGIQRVTHALHRELMRGENGDRRLLFPATLVEEPTDEPHPELAGDDLLTRVRMPLGEADWLLCLDLDVRLARVADELLAARARGLRIAVNVYDLLPVLHPEWFPRESGPDGFAAWLRVMLEAADLVLVNSLSTAEDLRDWVSHHAPQRSDSFELALLRLGSVFAAGPSPGQPEPRRRDHFLMVGTIEPRKGHAAVLDAFTRMWERGSQARLTVVGRGGWMVQDLLRRMSRTQRENARFRWAEGVNDQELRALYTHCTAVIMASEGEGFGLPIIEAAAHGCPIVSRDLPVFREIAGESATYFRADGADLFNVLAAVEHIAEAGELPLPTTEHLRPWSDVAAGLTALLHGQESAIDKWSPGGTGWQRRAVRESR